MTLSFSIINIVLILLIIISLVLCSDREDIKLDEVKECFESRIYKRTSIRKVRAKFSHKPGRPLIELDTAIDRLDMNHLNTLSDCIEENMPDWFESRLFDNGKTGYGGGNNVTYLSGIIQEVMPDFIVYIKDLLIAGTEYAGWRPHPSHLGIRCVEKLMYDAGGELLFHTDTDSIYTMTLMLSRPDQFTGGRFYIKTDVNSEESISAVPSYGGGVIFNSEMLHGVEPVFSGERVVIAIEFWPYEDAVIEDKRPPPDDYSILIPKEIVEATPFKKHPESHYDPLEESEEENQDEEEEDSLDAEQFLEDTYENISYLGISKQHGFGLLLGSFVGFLFPLFVGISYNKATSLANKNK